MSGIAGQPALDPTAARDALEAAIAAVRRASPPEEPYLADLAAFLAGFDTVGQPRLFHVEGRPARFLTPLLARGLVGAIVASDPFTGEVLSWPGWLPGPRAPFWETEEELLRLAQTGDPAADEYIPRRLDRANQFSVTPRDLERSRLIDGWDRLPYKNQEERHTWVEEVRAGGRMRTDWRYSPGVQYPAYKCLSYAGSTVVDWWGWRLGHPPRGRYQNLVNGLQEYGLDPRELEVLYHHRARLHPVGYPLLPAVDYALDPVTRERIPCSLRSYARLLASPVEQELADPLYRDDAPIYRYWPGKYHIDEPPRVLFASGRQDEQAIVDALESHGIVFAMTQTRILRVLRAGLHAIAIVGHYERDGQRVFVYHESYGNRAAGYLWDNSGGPGLMSIPVNLLRGAVAFPHRPWLDLDDGCLVVRHADGGTLDATADVTVRAQGRAVQTQAAGPGRLRLPGLGRALLQVELRHRHFLARDGGPVRVTVPWPGDGGRGAGESIARWLALGLQARAARVSPQPAWLPRALDESREAAARWVARAGEREAARRLQPLRELLLPLACGALRRELLRAFPVLR